MELRQIEAFLRVAKYKNFSRAAEKLGYTQAAITIQIRQLEKELGVHLFDRIGKQTLLTRQGEVFYHHAEAVMQSLTEAREELSSADELHGRLSLGAIESICTSVLPDVITRYHSLYPNVRISIELESPEVLLARMNRNELDMVYLLDKKICDKKWIKALEEPEEAVFVTAPETAAGLPDPPSLEELIRLPLILTERGASYRLILENYLAMKGLSIRPFAETGNTAFIIDLLKSGAGISLLPMYTVKKELEAGTLSVLPVKNFQMNVWRQIVYHKDKWVTREMKAFLELVNHA
ncbi:MAG: LysR family transcriptional regulator [Eubacteriales bacterium]|nr:LysR family transcriptional regulator [Eubacteriales bacterium]